MLQLEGIQNTIFSSVLSKAVKEGKRIINHKDNYLSYEDCSMNIDIDCDWYNDDSTPKLIVYIQPHNTIKPYKSDGNISNKDYISNTFTIDKKNAIFIRDFINSYLSCYDDNLKEMQEEFLN